MADLGDNTKWFEVDASNVGNPPDGWPEGMNPSAVNNSARAVMGAVKRFWDRINPTKTSAGSSTAYTLSYDQAASSYYDGELVAWVVDETCGNTPTLNINGLGARALRKWVGSWAAMTAGDLAVGQVALARYNLADTSFDVIVGQGGRLTGEIVSYAGSTAPDGWLLCYGQAVSRTTYAALFAVLGTTFGVGDGSTTFNLPDLRSRVAAGKSDMGGSDNGLLTGGTVLGAALGAQTNSASVSGTATGVLGVTMGGASALTTATGGAVTVAADHIHNASTTGSLNVSGSTSAFSVVQPTIILNRLIKT